MDVRTSEPKFATFARHSLLSIKGLDSAVHVTVAVRFMGVPVSEHIKQALGVILRRAQHCFLRLRHIRDCKAEPGKARSIDHYTRGTTLLERTGEMQASFGQEEYVFDEDKPTAEP